MITIIFNNDGIKKTYKSFDQITCLENYNHITEIICCFNELTQLPKLPHSLKRLNCLQNKLTQLPQLPNSLEILNCKLNKLTQLPKLPPSLNLLDCENNNLTQLPTLPHSLKILNCSYNNLTQFPLNIIYYRTLHYINYYSNPLDLTTQQINFIHWIKERNYLRNNNTIYNDSQNTHNSHIQLSLLKNINNLFNH